MAQVEYSSAGNIAQKACRLLWIRWGGGADPGRYHVFMVGGEWPMAGISEQCVVDDFGNLVRVPA